MNKLAEVQIGNEFLGKSFLNSPDLGSVGKLVSVLLTAALSIAGIIFLFLLVIGGIGIIAGAGNENPEQVAKGKQAATAAIIGFVIVIAAYWIVKLIGVIIGVNILG